jgi:DNA (cytosine-5)-methyltransferase 1
MKVLSLFSGVGGFDLGLEAAGMETVFQCEWDKHATNILEKHWPHVPRWGDISTLTGKHILAHAPVIDVVAWGSPCQDLSVAGKRAGLEGSRSGLFHEGVRIIKELRKETNNEYPRISIWENVYGALNSNRGADFGVILNEMAEAGALVQEWRVLDAQYFGVPQRRRRVFLISIFDTATATRCPDPLLPVSEGVQWHPSTSHTTRQTVTGETAASFGSGSDIANTIGASLYHKSTVVNQDVNNGHMVIEPFTKSKRPQTATDDETWVANQPNPTLNAFDQGDTRTTTAIVFENSYRDAARIAEDGITQTLTSKMGTGGGNTPMVAQSVNYSFDTQFGSNAEVYEDKAPPLKASQQSPSIAFATNQRAEVRELDDKAVALSAEPGTNQQTYVAFPIQDGREMEKNQNGIGVADDGTPAYTIDQTGAQAIAYGLQGNMIGRQDHNGPQGAGISHPNDPMFSLTSTDRHGVVQYDGYNQRLYEDDVSVTIRIGRDSSDFIAQPIEAAGFKAGQGAGAGGIGYQEGTSQTLTSQMNGIEPTVLTPTMAVRRLTPLECERLMGWPDNWTATKADGTPQSDTHRYKQCGNGVASPVAQWIGEILIATDTATATDAGATD